MSNDLEGYFKYFMFLLYFLILLYFTVLMNIDFFQKKKKKKKRTNPTLLNGSVTKYIHSRPIY